METRSVIVIILIMLLGPVCFAQKEKVPAYGILVDNTGSLRTQRDLEVEIAKEILSRLDPKCSVSIFGFASNPDPKVQIAVVAAGLECSSDRSLLNRQVEDIAIVGGQTTLVDAIKKSSERLGTAKPAQCSDFSERNLILVTDGEDRASETKVEDLVSDLKKDGIKVFAVGLINELGQDAGFILKSPASRSKEFLKKITSETGGRAVFPKNKPNVPEVVNELFGTDSKSSK